MSMFCLRCDASCLDDACGVDDEVEDGRLWSDRLAGQLRNLLTQGRVNEAAARFVC